MFFLIGWRTKAKVVGQVDRTCTKCARSTVQTVVKTRKWLTLFFVPTIPLSGDNQVVRCNVCGLIVKATSELETQLAAKAMSAKA